MIEPRKVAFMAKKKENENIRFRTYLKMHAKEEELDKQFLELHQRYFANYDCNRCRNCCKQFSGAVPQNEISQDAELLNLSEDEFISIYFEKQNNDGDYITKHVPCDFLQKDGSCLLGDCKPISCKNYPYTNQPERLQSLLSVLSAVEVCPVAYEIFEELKEIYGFKTGRH